MRWYGHAWIALAAVLLGGCGAAPDRAAITGAEYEVDDIAFEGATAFEEEQLLAHMVLREASWWPFAEKAWFTEGIIPADRRRIEALYAAHGYPDARVTDVRRVVDGDEVDLTFVIAEGRPVVVRRQVFQWPDGLPIDDEGQPVEAAAITDKARLVPGRTFSVEDLNASVADMRVALQERGFALATVQERAVIDRDGRAADVSYALRPGPFARIGEVRIVGLRDVPEELVRREIEFAPGKPYSPGLLKRMERAAFALNVFRSATAVTAERLDADGRLDVELRVAEAPPQSLRFGLGVAFEPNRWEERVDTTWSHRNLFGRLYQFDVHLKLGYAQLPTLYSAEAQGPVIELEPTLRKKGLLEEGLVWTLAPRGEIGIDEGYSFYTLENRVGVSRFFGRLNAELSHNYRYFDFYDLTPAFRFNRTVLGRDFRDPSLLSYLELRNVLYLTDSVLMPENGLVLEVDYVFAGSALGGDYDFHRVWPEVRAYWFVVDDLQLAARVASAFVLTYGQRPGAPLDLKLYLGGADTVRGWGLDRLSPQVPDCSPEQDCKGVPIGGRSMVLGNFEARWRAVGALWLVPFLDVGDVQEEELTYDPSMLNYSTGLGARYESPVGKIRLDVGIRLNKQRRFVDEPGWAFHLGLGESF